MISTAGNSIYSFLTTLGLLIALSSGIFSATQFVFQRQAKQEAELKLIELRKSSSCDSIKMLRNMAQYANLKELDILEVESRWHNVIVDSLRTVELKYYFDFSELRNNRKYKNVQIHQWKSRSEDASDYTKWSMKLPVFSFIIGMIVGFYGFYLWLIKVQFFEDIKIHREAKKLNKKKVKNVLSPKNKFKLLVAFLFIGALVSFLAYPLTIMISIWAMK